MFERVKVLHVAGNGIRAIVRETGFNWRTVAKWVQLDELPERNVMAPKSTTPGKFQTYLSRRWAEGCTTGRDLLPEIKCLGFTGSLSQLERLLTKWRAGHAVVFDAPAAKAGILTDPSTGQLVSPIVAAALCIKSRGLLTEPQAARVDGFKSTSAEFAAMRGLAMRFRGLRGNDTEKLDVWLYDADRSGLYGIRRFARFCCDTEQYARELTITADRGGSNGARVRLWKIELQRFADETGLVLNVHHYPPGTSKWNRIEHRLFCHITQTWRGRPLTDRMAVVELIAATTTKVGLKIESALDTRAHERASRSAMPR
jgi:hypothetical protein